MAKKTQELRLGFEFHQREARARFRDDITPKFQLVAVTARENEVRAFDIQVYIGSYLLKADHYFTLRMVSEDLGVKLTSLAAAAEAMQEHLCLSIVPAVKRDDIDLYLGKGEQIDMPVRVELAYRDFPITEKDVKYADLKEVILFDFEEDGKNDQDFARMLDLIDDKYEHANEKKLAMFEEVDDLQRQFGRMLRV